MNLLWASSLLFGLFLLGSAARIPLNAKYVITAPKVLSPKDSKVCLVPLHGTFSVSSENRWVEVVLQDPVSGNVLIQKREPLSVDDVTCVELPLTNIRHSSAELKVQVPEFLTEVRAVQVSPLPIGMSLIETSKPVYRPGDLLKFRIINFDGRMKLYETVLNKLSIYNPSGLNVMEWRDVTIENGMRLFTHPLAYHNIEGLWKIVAITYDNQVIEKQFQVDARDHQLLVDLRSEPYIYANEQQQRVILCAKNKYGVPVQGEFQIVAYQVPQQNLETLAGETDESGCLHVTLHESRLGWSQRVGSFFTLKATFTSENPNHLVTTTKQLFVVSSPIYLRKPSHKFVPNYFKPNLPYFGYLIASRPNSEPVVGQEVQICYEARNKAWISYENGRHCHTLQSGLNGVVKFVIPPVGDDVKQLYIEANIPGVSGHKQVFTVNPWTSSSRNHFVIEPRVVDNCEDEQNLFQIVGTYDSADDETVFWTRSTGSAKQGITKKRLTKSQLSQYLVQDPASVWPYTIGNWPSDCQIYRFPVEFNAQDDPEWHLERVVVFTTDSQGNLMSDSSSWIRNCATQNAPLELTRKDKELEIKLKSAKSGPCVFSVDTIDKRGKLTERKITKMLEQYDSLNDPTVLDKCALERKQRQFNGPYSHVTPLNYHNDWDVFTRGGLIPFSNYPIYDKPCGWESIPEELYNQTYLGYIESRKYMPHDDYVMDYQENQRDWARIYNEEYHLDEPIEWNLIPSSLKSMKINERSDDKREQKFVSRKNVHLNAICNGEKGMRIFNVKQQYSDSPFEVLFHVDQAARYQVVSPFHIIIRRSSEDVQKSRCVPVNILIEDTPYYRVVDYERRFCACGEYYQVNGHFLPLLQGSTNFTIVLNYDQSVSSCDYTSAARFETFTEQFPLDFGFGLHSGYSTLLKEIDIQCEKDQRVLKNYADNKFAVANDLLSVLSWKNKISLPMKKHIMHVLSNYLPLVQLYKNTHEKLPHQLKNQIRNQLSLTAQELYFYRLQDGSYKMNPSSRQQNFPATVTAYVTLSKARELGFQHDESDLSETYQWLASTLNSQGCVEIPREWYRNWTYSTDEKDIQTELTAFLVSMLYQTQSHQFITRKALKCIPENVQDQDNDLLNAMVASIWAYNHNTQRAQKFLNAIRLDSYTNQRSKLHATMFEPEHVTLQTKRDVLAFYLLTALHDQKLYVPKTFATVLRELAVNEETLEQPISLYSVAKAWLRVQKHAAATEVKISNKTLKLKPFEWKIIENFSQENKVEVRKGCAIFYRTAPIASRSQRDAKVEIKNLGIGYKNCGSRMVQICHSHDYTYGNAHRTYVFRYPSRYYLDEETMRQMTLARQTGVELYTKIPGGLMLVPSYGSQCVNIPIVQTYSVEEPVKGFVQIYEGSSENYSEPIEIEYEVPVECDVKNYDSTPVSYEIVQCPYLEDTTCPYCMSGSSSSCDNVNSFIGLPMQLTRRSSKWIPRSVDAIDNEKKCYKFKLQVSKINQNGEQGSEKTFYLRKECACVPPSQKGYILTSKLAENKEEHQLGSGDLVSFASNQQTMCNKKIRNRRDAQAAASTSNSASSRSAAAAENSLTSSKNERGYEAKGYASPPAYEAPPAEPKGYNAPPPAYEAPAYSAPAYAPPSYPAPAYAAPAYPAPAPSYESQQTYVDNYVPPPAYEAPAYAAPAYAPPSYSPPAYQAPAYQAPAYQAPAYAAPAYAPPSYSAPSYQAPAYQAPAYQAPAYQAPAYAAPAYAPPAYQAPAYQAPAYQAPAYQAPAYEPPAYQAPAYEAPKGYVAPPAYAPPAYEAPAPAYQAPAYSAPAYSAPAYAAPPAYEAPAYTPPAYNPPAYAPPAYNPPAYAPPAYEAPAYSAPAYSAPAYSAPAYSAPAYSAPAYSAPAYPAPAYSAPAYSAPPAYEAPAYTPPAYNPPAYAPPAYNPPAYAPPSYSAPAYAPPAYAPPAYEAAPYAPPTYEPYRNAGMKNLAARSQQATNAAKRQIASGRAISRSHQYSRNINGMTFRSASMQASPSEMFSFWTRPEKSQQQQQQCTVTSYQTACPRCYDSVSIDVMDKLCAAQNIYIAQPYENFGIGESPYRCGNYTVQTMIPEKTLDIENVPFTMNKQCSCQSLLSGPVVVLDDIGSTPVDVEGHKFADNTMIVPATQLNVEAIRGLVSSCQSA